MDYPKDDLRFLPEAWVRLQCLELAMTQAQREGTHYDRNIVVEISSRFYNHIAGTPDLVPAVEPETKTRKPKADKAPGIFE